MKSKNIPKDKKGFNKLPEKIFFFHWSYIVPKEIYNNYECINSHSNIFFTLVYSCRAWIVIVTPEEISFHE